MPEVGARRSVNSPDPKCDLMCLRNTLLACALAFAGSLAAAGEPSGQADHALFGGRVRPVLVAHCYGCHSGAAKELKGGLRLDQLSADFADEAARERWLAVLQRVRVGEMPPKSKPRPSPKDLRILTDWIGERAAAAEATRRAQGRVVFRRLNRVEYENTLRDLLGVEVNLRDMLPADASAHGFDNVGAALHLSSFQMEKYLDAADTALSLAVANGPQPKMVARRYSLKDQHQVKNPGESVFRLLGDTVVMFSSSPWQAVHLYQFYPPDRGRYRFRISACGFQSSGKPVTYRVDAGLMGMTGKPHLVGYFDAPADRPTVVEFVDHL